MNRNVPQQQHRESKHTSNAMTMDFVRCRTTTQPYPFSYNPKPYERQDTEDAVRSRSIPICKAALRRTASELKLSEDEATADFQDFVFFSRLLTGISKQQQESVSDKFLRESDACLAHIIGTRNGSLDSLTDGSPAFDDYERSYEEEKDEGIFLMDLWESSWLNFLTRATITSS